MFAFGDAPFDGSMAQTHLNGPVRGIADALIGPIAPMGTMPPVRVDQVIPSLASRDAIGVHTVAITEALRQVGIESDIFYGECTRPRRSGPSHEQPGSAHQGQVAAVPGVDRKPGLRHLRRSVGAQAAQLPQHHPGRPSRRWEPAVGHEVSLGRAQVTRVAAECRLAIADSAFNEDELIDVGFEHTAVAPLLIDMTAAAQPDAVVSRRLWPPKPTAARTSSSWARSLPTRPSTTW